MKYLLDSDTFIRSKNDSFRFDVNPGFWEWLVLANKKGLVFSIDRIRHELQREDQLSRWANHQGSGFFLKSDDSATAESLAKLAEWIQKHTTYSDAAKQKFLSSADFCLIGFAHAHDYTIVTFEKDSPDAISSIKIPSVCKDPEFDVRCVNIYQVLSEQKVEFRLKSPPSN
jgi:hypothetical protein